jgi:hypothetical protein
MHRISSPGVVAALLSRGLENSIFVNGLKAGIGGRMGYIKANISPVCFRFVFSLSFVINNMARFVFSFVFSTATCFQQLLRFVFRFVPVCFFARPFVFINLSALFFKITSFFVKFVSGTLSRSVK